MIPYSTDYYNCQEEHGYETYPSVMFPERKLESTVEIQNSSMLRDYTSIAYRRTPKICGDGRYRYEGIGGAGSYVPRIFQFIDTQPNSKPIVQTHLQYLNV
jgi:hypothetical protein